MEANQGEDKSETASDMILEPIEDQVKNLKYFASKFSFYLSTIS